MKLVEFDTSNLLPQEKFYAEGIHHHPVHSPPFVELLHDLWCADLPPSFSWEQKGQNSFHLRPSAHEFSRAFLDFLFDNAVPQLLEGLTSRDLRLYHVQVVKTTPGPSYQDWHRDAYQFGTDPFVGAFPPVVKVNFYPRFDQPEPRLKYTLGSHRCMLNDPRFDAMLASKYDVEVLESSNDRALVFESSLLHGVVPDVNPNGSIRVMYSFGEEHEYKKRFAGKPSHAKLHDEYCERAWL